jgi:conjugal transfer pilus assembly protein TraK
MKLWSLSSALAASLLLCAQAAHALQTLDARDGMSIDAIVSIKEPTRIRVEGAAITNVFGNIYSSNCSSPPPAAAGAPGGVPAGASAAAPAFNPQGEVILECDADKGEIYLRPVGGAGKPINLFVSTASATYTLILRRADTPADTIVLRDRSVRPANADQFAPAGRSASHVRSLKVMLGAIASDRVPGDIRVEDVLRPVQLWQEARFVLTRLYEGRGFIAERYQLTNISGATMVLAEQEFDREGHGVVAVSIENMNLRPGDSTAVYVIRHGSAR